MPSSMRFLSFILLIGSFPVLAQEFNGDFLGAAKDDIFASHPELKTKFSSKDTTSTDRWYYGKEEKKDFLVYYGEVGEYPVKFEYWFYDGDFLEGVYDFTKNHPDPEKRVAVSSTAILEILEMKYGKPSEVVGNITIWKIYDRVKYTVELMTTANQSPQILYRWNRKVDAWHKREIKAKSKDF